MASERIINEYDSTRIANAVDTLATNLADYSGTTVTPTGAMKAKLPSQTTADRIADAVETLAENVTSLNDSVRASYEESPTLYPHSVDEIIYYNGKLYKVITAISTGDTLVVDTNIEETDFDTDTAVYVVNMPGKAEGEIVVSKTSVSLNSTKRSDKVAVSINSDGIVTVSTSDSNVATAAYSNGVLTITSRYGGNCTVTISVSETLKYTAAVKTISVTSTQTYTIRLNMEDSNPNTWGEYIDCIVTPVSAGGGENEIDALMGYYPVVLKNGVEGKLIDPSDNSKYIDGTSISESDGDSMVAFPARGYRLNWYDSTHLDVSITNEENRDGYKYPTYKGDEVETFYHSMYEGFVDDGKLHSWSGKAPTVSQTIGTFRTQAQANGTGYEQRTFNELTYLQCCALIKYKGKNMQTALGCGFVNGNSAAATTGGTNTRGLNYGETTGKVQMKLFGIEDFWGNVFDFVDGISSNANRQIQVADGNFNDTGSGYTTVGASFSSDISGYLKDVIGTNAGGFAPASQLYGSATTYFCDLADVYASRFAAFGGYWTYADNAGLFRLSVSLAASSAYATCGSRLTYLKVKES